MKNHTIGIEIKLTGITRAQATEAVANHMNGTVTRTHGVNDTYEVKAPEAGRVWNIMSDASILTRK